MKSWAVKGGIGDFLQCVPYMLAHPEHRYLVASHSDCVQEFFGSLGIKVEELSLGKLNGMELCPRTTFLEKNPLPRPKVIGVHLGGSDYSTNIERRFGLPSKALPQAVFDTLELAAPRHKFVQFGPLAGWTITEQLAVLNKCECDALIGSDSAFKTMSSMLKIPTVVWMGDYKDEDRDNNFIRPYVQAGVMTVYHYNKELTDYAIWAGVKFSLDWINARIA